MPVSDGPDGVHVRRVGEEDAPVLCGKVLEVEVGPFVGAGTLDGEKVLRQHVDRWPLESGSHNDAGTGGVRKAVTLSRKQRTTHMSAVSMVSTPLSPGLLSLARALNLTPCGVISIVSPRLYATEPWRMWLRKSSLTIGVLYGGLTIMIIFQGRGRGSPFEKALVRWGQILEVTVVERTDEPFGNEAELHFTSERLECE